MSLGITHVVTSWVSSLIFLLVDWGVSPGKFFFRSFSPSEFYSRGCFFGRDFPVEFSSWEFRATLKKTPWVCSGSSLPLSGSFLPGFFFAIERKLVHRCINKWTISRVANFSNEISFLNDESHTLRTIKLGKRGVKLAGQIFESLRLHPVPSRKCLTFGMNVSQICN